MSIEEMTIFNRSNRHMIKKKIEIFKQNTDVFCDYVV